MLPLWTGLALLQKLVVLTFETQTAAVQLCFMPVFSLIFLLFSIFAFDPSTYSVMMTSFAQIKTSIMNNQTHIVNILGQNKE